MGHVNFTLLSKSSPFQFLLFWFQLTIMLVKSGLVAWNIYSLKMMVIKNVFLSFFSTRESTHLNIDNHLGLFFHSLSQLAITLIKDIDMERHILTFKILILISWYLLIYWYWYGKEHSNFQPTANQFLEVSCNCQEISPPLIWFITIKSNCMIRSADNCELLYCYYDSWPHSSSCFANFNYAPTSLKLKISIEDNSAKTSFNNMLLIFPELINLVGLEF